MENLLEFAYEIFIYLPVPSSFESGNLVRPLLLRCNLKTLESCNSVGISAIGTPSHTTDPYSAALNKKKNLLFLYGYLTCNHT